VEREQKPLELELQLAPLTSNLLEQLPAETFVPPPEVQGAKGLLTLKLPEEKQDCFVYVPDNYHANLPHALLVWLAPPGEFNKQELEKRWKALSAEYHFIVIAPRPVQAGVWQRGEVAVVRKFIELAQTNYAIDKHRIAVHGRQISGSMAWHCALAHRNLIRGVAVVDAPLPERVEPSNDPVQRLFVWSAWAKDAPKRDAIEAGQERLRAGKVPLWSESLDMNRDLNATEQTQLIRWLDTLDRL
jgi:poly(3-hydroxybutyrate) depolymerase